MKYLATAKAIIGLLLASASSVALSVEVTLAHLGFEQSWSNTPPAIGTWTHSPGWYIDPDNTPSTRTGPSGPAVGGYYGFFEANYTGPNVHILSPYIDLNDYGEFDSLTLTFYHHMYGEDIGELSVEIVTGSGSTTVWSLSGEQDDAWEYATVDLTSFAGDLGFRIRFNAEKGPYGTKGDIGLDDIELVGNVPLNGFNESYKAFLSTVDATSIALTDSSSPQVGDIRLAWNSSTQSYSASTVSSTSGWQALSNVELAFDDFNIDGTIDVILKNLDASIMAINGLFDQFVFAGNAANSVVEITPVDDSLKKFFTNVRGWFLDEGYFGQFWIDTSTIYESYECDFVWYYTIHFDTFDTDNSWQPYCSYYSQEVSDGYYNGDYVSAKAMQVSMVLDEIFGLELEDIERQNIEAMSQTWSDVISVSVPLGSQQDCSDAPALQFVQVVVAGCGALAPHFIRLIGVIGLHILTETGGQEENEIIYRAYGTPVLKEGRSWTPTYPMIFPDFRDSAGLPEVNACTHIVVGELLDDSEMQKRWALPSGNPGDPYYKKGGEVWEYYWPNEADVQPAAWNILYGRVIEWNPPC